MNGPRPEERHPVEGFAQIGFLKHFVTSPQIEVGDYTYYHDFGGPENFERNVLYLFPFVGDRLVIGKFCAIAHGAKFIMNGANHAMTGFSTYPFSIFGRGWEAIAPREESLNATNRGDTIVGNDVWLGYESLILPGVRVGDGAVVGARAVVTREVPPYTIVGGNPARPIRQRFDAAVVAKLLEVKWWDWPVERITANLERLQRPDVEWLMGL